MSEREGKFVVIDGNDGSGKTTQLELLENSLSEQGIPVRSFDFPQYDEFHGRVIQRFLNGEFGELENVPPELITYVYAEDRHSVAPQIIDALENGEIVLANRYVSSNLAHQSGRVEESRRDEFVEWNEQLEYEEMGNPREDLVIYLFVPHGKARELMQNADRSNRAYAQGAQTDLVESSEEYLSESEQAYLRLTEQFAHWRKIDCVDSAGEMRTREEIHEEIVGVLREEGVLPK